MPEGSVSPRNSNSSGAAVCVCVCFTFHQCFAHPFTQKGDPSTIYTGYKIPGLPLSSMHHQTFFSFTSSTNSSEN